MTTTKMTFPLGSDGTLQYESPLKLSDERIEHIARRYCGLMGLDPDKKVQHGVDATPGGWCVPDVLLHTPLWRRVAQEVQSRMAWYLALSESKLND